MSGFATIGAGRRQRRHVCAVPDQKEAIKMRQYIHFTIALMLSFALVPAPLYARGFGGGGFHAGGGGFSGGGGGFRGGGESFHGGGESFHGGGESFRPSGESFHSGGFSGGEGFRSSGFSGGESFRSGGGYSGGGYRPSSFGGSSIGGGGFHEGGFNASAYHMPESFGGQSMVGVGGGGERMPIQSNYSGGHTSLPTDGINISNARQTASPEAVARGGASGSVHEGPGGTTVYHGEAAAGAAGRGPAGGAAAGGRAAEGTVVKGPEGNVYAHGKTAAGGVAEGPRGGVAAGGRAAEGTVVKGAGGGVYAHGQTAAGGAVARQGHYSGTAYHSAAVYHSQGNYCRNWHNDHPVFTSGWIHNHPWAWAPAAYAAGWASAVWAGATWPGLGGWLGWGDLTPAEYVYGDNVGYQDGDVYYGDTPVATQQQYYQQAADLAQVPVTNPPAADAQWMTLGVFGLLVGDEKDPESVYQLAIDKNGIIQGNCFITASNQTVAVQGSVDKASQRAVFKPVGNDVLVETGIYNLTTDEAPALVHYSAERTEQGVLVRMQENNQSGDQSSSAQ